MSRDPRNQGGFTLPEVMMVIAVLGIIMGMALPVMTDMTAAVKLGDAAHLVEREMQTARLRSVAVNRSLRVRLNCPAAGYIRTVEVLGTAVDTAANRCLQSAYPFPPVDTEMTTVPNFDGPVKALTLGATVTSQILEFRSDGTAYEVVADVAQPIATPVVITITRQGKSKTVTINGTGKVQLQ